MIPRRTPQLLAVIASAAIALLAARPALAKGRYYVEVAAIEEGPGVALKFGPKAVEVMKTAFKKRSEFTVAEGTFAPPSGTKAYLVKGRIDVLKQEVKPPAPGKRYKTIQVEAKVSLLGTTKPGKSFGFRGDGEAIVATETARASDAEVRDVARDALGEAFAKAVEKAVAELAGSKKRKKR